MMKEMREDIYFDTEEKKMLASNLAASLNIPPDITITAVSVPAKPMTPPPAPKFGYHNNMHSNANSPVTPMNLILNSPVSVNNQTPLSLNISSNMSNRSSPMNFSLNSPSSQSPMNQNNVVNLSAPNQSSSNVNNQTSDNQGAAQNVLPSAPGNSKYSQLLEVIEDIGRDVRPTYSGSKSSAERLRRSIGLARILIRQCVMETEPNIKQ